MLGDPSYISIYENLKYKSQMSTPTPSSTPSFRKLLRNAYEECVVAGPGPVEIKLGDAVATKIGVQGVVEGVCMYIGFIDAGQWVGIELQKPVGRCDGMYKGKRHFTCEPSHGIFVRIGACTKVNSAGIRLSASVGDTMSRLGDNNHGNQPSSSNQPSSIIPPKFQKSPPELPKQSAADYRTDSQVVGIGGIKEIGGIGTSEVDVLIDEVRREDITFHHPHPHTHTFHLKNPHTLSPLISYLIVSASSIVSRNCPSRY